MNQVTQDWRGEHLIRAPKKPEPEKTPTGSRLDPDVLKTLRKCSADGMTLNEAARYVNRSRNAVWKLGKKYGFSFIHPKDRQ